MLTPRNPSQRPSRQFHIEDPPHEAAAAAATPAREVMELGVSSLEEERDPENDTAPASPKLVQMKGTVSQRGPQDIIRHIIDDEPQIITAWSRCHARAFCNIIATRIIGTGACRRQL